MNVSSMNHFERFLLRPDTLSEQNLGKVAALAASILLGVLTLGTVHCGVALAVWLKTRVSPHITTPASEKASQVAKSQLPAQAVASRTLSHGASLPAESSGAFPSGSRPESSPVLAPAGDLATGGSLLLRTFDLFGIQSTAPADRQPPISILVNQVRSVGKRRPEVWLHEEVSLFSRVGDCDYSLPTKTERDKIRSEARFLGITEVEYKEALCTENPTLSETVEEIGSTQAQQKISWKEQIQNEKAIVSLLDRLAHPSTTELAQLISLLKDHPPLSTPHYFAQLFLLFLRCPPQYKQQLSQALAHAINGVNSRRMPEFFSRALQEIRKLYPEVTREQIVRLSDQPISPQDERAHVLAALDADIRAIREFQRTGQGPFAGKNPQNVFPWLRDTGSASISWNKLMQRLEEARAVVVSLKGELPRYYHATNAWKEAAADAVLVSGGVGAKMEGLLDQRTVMGGQYSGAFVSTVPETKYGSTCFAFTEEMGEVAQAVVTQDTIEAQWYGTNRAIPINTQADAYKTACWNTIVESFPIPQTLSPLEQKAFKLAVMLWLENWTSVSYAQDGGWILGVRVPPTESPNYGIPPNHTLNTDPRVIEECLKAALHQGFPSCASYIDTLALPPLPRWKPNPDNGQNTTSLSAVFVDETRAGVTLDEVKEQLRQRGIPNTIPVISWATGVTVSHYVNMVQVRPPRRSDSQWARERAIHPKISHW